MKTISYLLIIAFLALFTLAILGATNYAGIGTAIGDMMATSVVAPLRNLAVNSWISIGASGWYIVISVLTISIIGALFWVPIVYGIFWKKLISEKVLHRTPTMTPTYQNQPQSTIPITNLQSQPTTVAAETKNPFNKTEEQT